ncbi:hypothetical protein DB35_04995 [Streptomyces abyssalis]|uniref:Uncharacterized protein n=1 Tax=Streptomyces abyssalis TaxID=933944 RepID=A0A1E7JQJ3_9ACTN|nr:hypothetical protein AN215_14070 [Streptomyces abyssalis]OEU95277.1 hypothetical protein DB35_04995 [Streptomyces abyssalis]
MLDAVVPVVDPVANLVNDADITLGNGQLNQEVANVFQTDNTGLSGSGDRVDPFQQWTVDIGTLPPQMEQHGTRIARFVVHICSPSSDLYSDAF